MKPPIEDLAAAQPPPEASDHPPVLELLIETLRTRSAAGALKYGTHLKPFNGRDALVDLLQELADGCMYVMQAIAERDAGIKASNAAMERMERDLYLRLTKVEEERDAARRAAEDWATTAGEYKRWQTSEPLAAYQRWCEERQAAQDPSSGPQCSGTKAREVGACTFVIRRCKLADGHEGMCEPA